MSFFLGIDLGTSYFKVGIFDEQARLVGLGRCAVEKQTDDDLICELPITKFWNTLAKCVNEALEKAQIKANQILSVSYSSQANSFVLLDKNNKPLTPLILWPDKRADKMYPAIKLLTARSDFKIRTGLGILPGTQSMISKLIWFQENKSEIWTEVKSIMTISDYLIFSLTGKKVSDFSTASMTGLFDLTEEKWWPEALELLNIDTKLLNSPERAGTYVGTLKGVKVNQLGLGFDTKFFLGGLDHHIVAVGAGLLDTTNISVSIGTVLACVNNNNEFQPADGVNISPGLTKGNYFQMAYSENGATALEWYQKTFAPEFSIEELLEMAENVDPGCEGLKALNCADKYESLSGFQNIQNHHSNGHFVRVILESTGLSLSDLVSSLDKENHSETLIASGGGARSHLWIQIKANILNKVFIVPECSELACKGAALIGLMGLSARLNRNEIFESKFRDAQIINPNSVDVEKYKLQNRL